MAGGQSVTQVSYGECRSCGANLYIRPKDYGTTSGGTFYERYCWYCGLVQ